LEIIRAPYLFYLTLAATHEFPRLEAGDEVQVDIFYNMAPARRSMT
jgi:hypothetical protein